MSALQQLTAALGGLSKPTTWTFSVSSSDGTLTTGYQSQAALSDGITAVASSVWGSSAGTNGFISADFGSAVYVTSAMVMCIRSDFQGWGAAYTNGRTLQYSNDGTSWTDIVVISGVADSVITTIPVGIVCRYVRIFFVTSGYIGVGDFYFA